MNGNRVTNRRRGRGEPDPRFRGSRLGAVLFSCALAAVLLAPGSARCIADLTVMQGFHEPIAEAGGEFLMDFQVLNLGPDSTSISGISNYVFLWDPALEDPLAQLSPVTGHNVHIWRSLAPGEIVLVGPFTVTIPWDTPLDTVVTVAIATDWLDFEVEPNETNNMVMFDVPVEPLTMSLGPGGASFCDTLGEPGAVHRYQFSGTPGQMVFAETFGEGLQSFLDLYSPSSGEGLAGDGDIEEIGERSRISYIDLPLPEQYRIALGGRGDAGGPYCLLLQEGLPELEPNDDFGSAGLLPIGHVAYGTLGYPGDADYYMIQAPPGRIVTIDVDADEALEALPDSTLDPQIAIFGPGSEPFEVVDDTYEYDPHFSFVIPDPGPYFFKIEGPPGDGVGGGYPEHGYVVRLRDDGPATQDLLAENVTPAGEPWYMDCPMQLDFTVTNVGGNRTYAGVVTVTIVLSNDPLLDPLDTLLAVGDFLGDLEAGETTSRTVFVTVPPEWNESAAYVGIVVDPTESEVETDETNNSLLVPVLIDPSQIGTGTSGAVPSVNALHPNRPNPFNPATGIGFSLERPSRAVVRIFDTAGREVRTLVDADLPAGPHSVSWDGRNDRGQEVSTGIYFYRLEAGDFRSTHKMALLR
ncbi:MAG: FlgD immunoglobulin-like domain containing protein [Candidatus Eisenbacteria bacterium]